MDSDTVSEEKRAIAFLVSALDRVRRPTMSASEAIGIADRALGHVQLWHAGAPGPQSDPADWTAGECAAIGEAWLRAWAAFGDATAAPRPTAADTEIPRENEGLMSTLSNMEPAHATKAPTITVDDQMFRGLVRAAELLETWQDGKIWDNSAGEALALARTLGFARAAPRPTAAVELARAGLLPESRGRARETIDALNELLERIRTAAGVPELPVLELPERMGEMRATVDAAKVTLEDVARAAGLEEWTDSVSARASLVEHVGTLRRNMPKSSERDQKNEQRVPEQTTEAAAATTRARRERVTVPAEEPVSPAHVASEILRLAYERAKARDVEDVDALIHAWHSLQGRP